MKRAWFSLLVLLVVAGLLSLSTRPGKQPDAAAAAGLAIGEPIAVGNLTIFPVVSKTAKRDDRFITLDEGLQAGTVEILEVGAVDGAASSLTFADVSAPRTSLAAALAEARSMPAVDPFEAEGSEAVPVAESASQEPIRVESLGIEMGNVVNQLMVVNRSERPLYLMPGEVIVGGDQDRTIGEELVIAPTGKPTPISVFCVESGRWGGRSEAEYAQLIADSRPLATTVVPVTDSEASNQFYAAHDRLHVNAIAQQANAGKFIASIGSLNKGARIAVQHSMDQGEVWDQVAQQNAATGVAPASQAFTANYSDKDVVEQLGRYQEQLQEPVSSTENVVGVIVAVDGKVESMDVFESTPLFQKLWPKLLKSYSLDAVNAQRSGKPVKQVGRSAALAFMNDVASAQAKAPTSDESGVATVQAENDRVLLFSAHAPHREAAGAMRVASPADPLDGFSGGLGGGLGGIHNAAFSK